MIKYEHLLGTPWKYGSDDCYGIVRRFYKDNYEIDLPNYARPDYFWEKGMNMYMDRFMKNDFRVLQCHPVEYMPGDVFLMSIQSTVVNHAGVLIDNGKMLHHLVNQVSTITPYKGIFRNNTVAVVRKEGIPDLRVTEQAEILDFVSPRTRRKIEEYVAENTP